MATQPQRHNPLYSFKRIRGEIDPKQIDTIFETENTLRIAVNARERDSGLVNQFQIAMCEEVATMRIVVLEVIHNGSIIHDEGIKDRLGVFPIVADAVDFEKVSSLDDMNERNTLKFELKLDCPAGSPTSLPVLSSDVKWIPLGDQEFRFAKNPPRLLYDDVKLFTLTPGQRVDIAMYCARGTGRIHAGWRPVSVVGFKKEPRLEIREPISGDSAEKLVKLCPKNVFDIEDGFAVVRDKLECTMCRECLREYPDQIVLGYNQKRTILTIESLGVIPPREIMGRALRFINAKPEPKQPLAEDVAGSLAEVKIEPEESE